MNLTEATLEQITLSLLNNEGYTQTTNSDLLKTGVRPNTTETILWSLLEEALIRINPTLPIEAIEQASRQLRSLPTSDLIEINKYYHHFLTDGIDVSVEQLGMRRTLKVWLVDFEDVENNDFLEVNQFVVEGVENRRPDVVLFLNGMPIVVIELKSLINEDVSALDAFNQIQTYKREIPTLFYTNLMNVLSDGVSAKIGSLSANFERFMFWRGEDKSSFTELEQLISGALNPKVIIDFIQKFTLFQEISIAEKDSDGGIDYSKKTVKIIAGYHQYYAVLKAVEKTEIATGVDGDGKIGVIWHTQGSGKSLTMVFYAASLLTVLKNPTLVILTDRNDLDDQLFATFSQAEALLRQAPKQANSREDLKELLTVESGGVIFTTIQKFGDSTIDSPPLTLRKNVVVIVDEAHRSQYGFAPKIANETGKVRYGNARYMRNALPNASFIGFTGTPIEEADKSTPAVFGKYIDVYDMTQAVEDGATVKLYYEPRVIKLALDEDKLSELDRAFDLVADLQEGDVVKANLSVYERVVGSPERLEKVAKDVIEHFTTKNAVFPGKAMIVVMSRTIAVDLYNEIVKQMPSWHSDDVMQGKIKVVMSGNASDNKTLSVHTGGKNRRNQLAERMKNEDDALELVIVCDMWLTGFDVPSLHTIYIDKPMKGHNLMQAIARVNRVFKDKPGGAIVDYIGILSSLEHALKQYTDRDKETTSLDMEMVTSQLLEKVSVVSGMLHELEYKEFFHKSDYELFRGIKAGMDVISGLDEAEVKEFKDVVLEAAKLHALAATTDIGQNLAYEVAYFKAIRSGLVKLNNLQYETQRFDANAQMEKLLAQSIIAEKIIDINDLVGVNDGEISILSQEFLEEVSKLEHKNVAVELMKRILQGKIRSIERLNLAKSEKFSEQLRNAINMYHNQAITNTEMLEMLLSLAKEINSSDNREEEFKLTREEMAFYDALIHISSVEEIMKHEDLVIIAREVAKTIRKNKTVDWNNKSSALPNMRRQIKRLLKQYGYPPDKQNDALAYVMLQVEKTADHVPVFVDYMDWDDGELLVAEDEG